MLHQHLGRFFPLVFEVEVKMAGISSSFSFIGVITLFFLSFLKELHFLGVCDNRYSKFVLRTPWMEFIYLFLSTTVFIVIFFLSAILPRIYIFIYLLFCFFYRRFFLFLRLFNFFHLSLFYSSFLLSKLFSLFLKNKNICKIFSAGREAVEN